MKLCFAYNSSFMKAFIIWDIGTYYLRQEIRYCWILQSIYM